MTQGSAELAVFRRVVDSTLFEAVRFDGRDIARFVERDVVVSPVLEPTAGNPSGVYGQLRGGGTCVPGDWIVFDAEGGFCVFKADAFAEAYEPVLQGRGMEAIGGTSIDQRAVARVLRTQEPAELIAFGVARRVSEALAEARVSCATRVSLSLANHAVLVVFAAWASEVGEAGLARDLERVVAVTAAHAGIRDASDADSPVWDASRGAAHELADAITQGEIASGALVRALGGRSRASEHPLIVRLDEAIGILRELAVALEVHVARANECANGDV